MRDAFLAAGFTEGSLEEDCGVFVVNTCTVTGEADRQCRQLIRRILRSHPESRVIVTGCLTRNPDFQNDFPERVSVISGDQKAALAEWLGGENSGAQTAARQKRIRALLKVQEGCDHFCSYCIVPYVRGRSRSREQPEALEEAGRLSASGYRELVLCGVHLGVWGRDFSPPQKLETLVEALICNFGHIRFRLSSLEPMDFSFGLLELMKKYPNFCPHLHLPLQHAAPSVLKRMKRDYDPQLIREFWEKSRSEIPGLSLSLDIMTGFPGETPEEFEELYRFLAALPVYHMHVFAYSPRPGTPAANFPGQIPPQIKKARSKKLLELNREKESAFLRENLGRTLLVLPETRSPEGILKGRSENYLPVEFPGTAEQIGAIVPVSITSLNVSGNGLTGIA